MLLRLFFGLFIPYGIGRFAGWQTLLLYSRRNGAAGQKQNIMLEQFTWQQFLIAAMILSLVWYAVIVLLYYRKDIAKFKSKDDHKQPERLQREWEEELEDEPEEDTLMGRTKEPEGVSSVPMDALRFAPKEEDPDDYRDTALGIVPDVLEELKSIFHILENEGGTKEDFISLFALVSSKYTKIKGTPNQQALNEYIRENVLFPISDEELDQLWK